MSDHIFNGVFIGGKVIKFFCPVCRKERYIAWSDLRKKIVYEKRREELNGLLVDHRETLCAYWGEGVRSGLHKGYVIGAIGSTICFATVYGIIKLISRHKSKNES